MREPRGGCHYSQRQWGLAQWTGIVCRLGPALGWVAGWERGLTLALNTVQLPPVSPPPTHPPTPHSSPCTQTPPASTPSRLCNVTPGSPSVQSWKTVTESELLADLNRTGTIKRTVDWTSSSSATVPHNPSCATNSLQAAQPDTSETRLARAVVVAAACAQSEVLVTTIKAENIRDPLNRLGGGRCGGVTSGQEQHSALLTSFFLFFRVTLHP